MTLNDLFLILQSECPSSLIKQHEKDIFEFIPALEKCKGFDQNNDWHIYDVYEHILHVIDNTDNVLELRLAALFHDVGKPITYSVDENGVGHFYNHWIVSMNIFNDFASNKKINKELKENVSKLIFYHDMNLLKVDSNTLDLFLSLFDKYELKLLFNLKRADLMAQNPKYAYFLNNIEEQENMIKHLTNSKKML